MDWSMAVHHEAKFDIKDTVFIIKGIDEGKFGKIIQYIKGSIYCWQVMVDDKPKWYSTDQLRLKHHQKRKHITLYFSFFKF